MHRLTCLLLLLLPVTTAADHLPTMTRPEVERFLGRPLTGYEAWVTSPGYAHRLRQRHLAPTPQVGLSSTGVSTFWRREAAHRRYRDALRWYQHSPVVRDGEVLRVFRAWERWQATR